MLLDGALQMKHGYYVVTSNVDGQFQRAGFDEACIATAERLAMSGRDVALFQVLTADERDFPFAHGYRFHDPETGREIVGDGRALRQDFNARFADARATLSARLEACGIRHVEHFTDESADLPIRSLFRSVGRA